MKYFTIIALSFLVGTISTISDKKDSKVGYLHCFTQHPVRKNDKVQNAERKRTRDIIRKNAPRYTSSFANSHFTTTATVLS
jgi:hypothetical protein